jgi:hypothetical protein
MHAIHHVNNLDEIDALWREVEAIHTQIDELYVIMFRLAGALNAMLPVPIKIDL